MAITVQKNDNTHSTHKVNITNLGLKTLNVVPCYCHQTLPTMWEALNIINLSNCRTMYESGTCWGTALAMSSRVANRLPRIGSVILGMRSKSQGEMSGEYGGAPILPIPNVRVAAVHTMLYVVLHCRAGILHCQQDPDVYPERHVVPVAPGSPCITVLF
ncbi:uncharacterized protein TNCV_2463391 [Trichonephila clavipes]|nr:uncharacterized protein TNCV_2463391 [Trichonephila clavipes]